MKRQDTVWEEILANPISDKGILSRIYKEVLKLNKKINNLVLKKQAKDLNRRFTEENICMSSTWKGVQYL